MIETVTSSFLRALGKPGVTGFLILLLSLPIFLKLIGAIDWPWIWAFAPFWMLFVSTAAVGALVALFGIVYLIVTSVWR